jgi:type I restriction enzyme M protein
VLGLIFLKFASDKFEQRKKELIEDGKEKYVEMKDFYTMKNVFFLEDISRWNYIIKNAKQKPLMLVISFQLLVCFGWLLLMYNALLSGSLKWHVFANAKK